MQWGGAGSTDLTPPLIVTRGGRAPRLAGDALPVEVGGSRRVLAAEPVVGARVPFGDVDDLPVAHDDLEHALVLVVVRAPVVGRATLEQPAVYDLTRLVGLAKVGAGESGSMRTSMPRMLSNVLCLMTISPIDEESLSQLADNKPNRLYA